MRNYDKRKIVAGEKYGLLTAIRVFNDPRPNARWLCQCECGHEKIVIAAELGRTTFSCGCWQKQVVSAMGASRKGIPKPYLRTHGMSKTAPEYKVWAGMINRCSNPNNSGYHHYGGRGITVCDRWKDFANFYADMGPRPTPKHQLGRINNDGNYEPGNVEWQPPKVNCRNKRTTRLVTAFGKTQSVADWSEEYGIEHHCLSQRLDRGWPVEKAITAKPWEWYSDKMGRWPRNKQKGKTPQPQQAADAFAA